MLNYVCLPTSAETSIKAKMSVLFFILAECLILHLANYRYLIILIIGNTLSSAYTSLIWLKMVPPVFEPGWYSRSSLN